MRIAIAFVLFVICAYIGCVKPSAVRKRIGIMEELERDIRRLSLLIEHRKLPLSELMQELESPLWAKTAQRLEGTTFYTAWMGALEELVDSGEFACLDARTLAVLSDFGGAAGTADMEAQSANAALAIKRLEEGLARSREEYRKKARVYRSLGILGGAAAALMVM